MFRREAMGSFLLQIHIDQEEEVSRTPGPVKLLLPKLADIEAQLQKLQPRFENSCFAFDFSPNRQAATVVDPWGQQFSVTESSGEHATSSSFEGLVLPCHPGTAAAIAEFYRRILRVSCADLSLGSTHAALNFATAVNRCMSMYMQRRPGTV